MKVKELLDKKYSEWLKKMYKREWENILSYAEAEKMHPAEYMYSCLKITEYDIRANGGYGGELYKEIVEMHQQKLLASNKGRHGHHKVDVYWLTKKGLKQFDIARA